MPISFSIDPNSSRIWVVATAPDASDGTADGISERSALYGLDLVAAQESPCLYSVEVGCMAIFEGTSATTPSLRTDGTKIYIGNDAGQLVAYGSECEEVWSINVEAHASVAVSTEMNEIYAGSSTITKIIDVGNSAEIAWQAQLGEPLGFLGSNISMIGPSLGINGLYVQLASGFPHLPLSHVGIGILDRETGVLRSFQQGGDETSAMIPIGPDGAAYVPLSPFRRAITRVLLGYMPPPLMGGVQKFEAATQ